MKKSTKAAIALSSLMLCSSVFAGGVEVPPPTMWDFYIGGSGVAYGYEHRLNSLVTDIIPTTATTATAGEAVFAAQPVLPYYRSITVLGGFDLGIGVWADRGYFGVEGRYDIGTLTAEFSHNDVSLFGNATATAFSVVSGTNVYTATMRNNASVVGKVGYQLLPRTMSYLILGWARTSYRLNVRTFGIASTVAPTFNREIYVGRVLERTLNGATVGFGMSHLLVDGLSAFWEFALSGYHFHSESPGLVGFASSTVAAAAVSAAALHLSTGVFGINYYNYNLRLGLNWSFASLL